MNSVIEEYLNVFSGNANDFDELHRNVLGERGSEAEIVARDVDLAKDGNTRPKWTIIGYEEKNWDWGGQRGEGGGTSDKDFVLQAEDGEHVIALRTSLGVRGVIEHDEIIFI